MIIPTVFAHNKKEFDERLKKLLPVSKNLQIDFMDGKFVKSKSISLSTVPNLKRYNKNFEAHLMVSNPEAWISKLKKKGFKKILFHVESENVEKTLSTIEKSELDAWLAINPSTKISSVLPFLDNVRGVLFMGVKPGREHQKFIRKVYKKIKQLRKINKKIKVQVDGGANEKTISKLAKLGVDHINSGSFISDSKDPKQTFNKLNKLFKESK